VTKLEHERVNFGGVWHSDTTYLERPPLGSLLRVARSITPRGKPGLRSLPLLSPGLDMQSVIRQAQSP